MTLEKTVKRENWRNALDEALKLLDKRIQSLAGTGYRYEYIVFGDVQNLSDYKAPKCKQLKLAVTMYHPMPEEEKGRIVIIPRKVTGFFPATDAEGNPLLNENGLPQVRLEEHPLAWLEQDAAKPFEAPQFKIAEPNLAFLIKFKE